MIFMRLLSPKESAGGPEKFETLLGRLEEIVQEMEGAELPLEQLLSRYEQGMNLVKLCGDRLSESEQKVEILSKSLPQLPVSEPEEDDGAEEDEVRLF